MGGKGYKALILVPIIIGTIIGLTSCLKDKPPSVSTLPGVDTGNVYIVCEGNFGNGDASLYLYRPQKDSVYGDLYMQANHQPLGDVFQSMTAIGNYFFLCVNNSDKVVVINKDSWRSVASISIPKPRYILPISNTKAYVSTLYSNKVYIINPQTFQVIDTINLPSMNPEGMLLYNNTAYITSWDTGTQNIYSLNAANDNIVQTITVADAPQEVLLDKEQMLWVLSGDQPEGKTAMLSRIDPSTGEVLKLFTFPANADPLRPVFNITKDTLYFIEANYYGGTDNNGIYRMSIHDATLPAQAFVAAGTYQYFWALGIDPATGNIYVGDPKGFVQKGTVTIYRTDGTIVNQFNTGVGPGHFYFD